jgi:predicted nucleotidyltransferase
VAYGSWARDELAQRSDVDLLIIVDRTFEIDRDLYRRWDEAPVTWGGHPVEPHFVHLPEPGGRISGTWAAVAVDGVVLFERDLLVSRRLVELRRVIVSGRLAQRRSHGQSYWVEVA